VADGTQTLLILTDIDFSGHKKATVEANTVKCVDHCELLSAPANP
jgi:5S rRNA maturation endonuclease (ribonuclease M5)